MIVVMVRVESLVGHFHCFLWCFSSFCFSEKLLACDDVAICLKLDRN